MKLILIMSTFFVCSMAWAQLPPVSVCTSPTSYSFNEEVSWYYDLSGNDLAVPGDTLYFWSWEPNTPPNGAVPLINIKDRIWRLTWTPTEYYEVDLGTILAKGNGAFWHAIQDSEGNAITGTIPFEMKEKLRLGAQCDCIGQPSTENNMFLVNFSNQESSINGEDNSQNYWTNVTSNNASFALVDSSKTHRYDIRTSGSFLANNNADFTSPNAVKLGELAETNATNSYLYLESGSSGQIDISCLNPNHSYKLSILGSRNTTSERITSYSVTGATTLSGNIQTSGQDLGSGDCTHCNDDELFEVEMTSNQDGFISILVETNNSFGYINAMKIVESIPDLVPITNINIVGENITTPEGTSQMSVEITPTEATNKAVKWSVEPSNLATINESGLLTAKGNGTVTVTATSVDGSGVKGAKDITITGQLYSLQQVFLIDFGTTGNQTSSPDSKGSHWTNFIDGASHALVNTDGISTAYTLSEDDVLSSYPGNNGGLSGPGEALGSLALSTVTEDYFTTNNPNGAKFYIDNLDPEKIYKFTIFATRQSTSGRITKFDIIGSSSFSEELIVSGNRSKLVTSPYLFPNDTGAVSIQLTDVGENDFVYIGGMMIEEVVYEGSVASAVSISGTDIKVPGKSTQLTADVTIDGAGITDINWSLSNDSIAYLDSDGILYPKGNGTVEVIATVAIPDGPSDTLEISVSNQIIGDLYLFGDGIEGDPDGSSLENAIAMKQLPAPNGILSGVFTTFTGVDATGAFQFYKIQADTAVYYGVNESGEVVEGGAAIAPSSEWTGPVRLRVDLTQGNYEVVWDYQLLIKGNGTKGAWGGEGATLNYAGNGIWSDTVDFTFSDAPNDATFFRYYVESTDNYGNYRRYQKLTGSRNTLVQDFPDESGGRAFTTIDLNQGKYIISINMQDLTFKMKNTVEIEDGIAFMGSSVAAGYPVPTAQGPYKGYAYKYDSLLQQRFDAGVSETDWATVNISIGGNTTHDLEERFEENLIPSGMSYVWYGLALANQGILSATDKQALADEFLTGMQRLIDDAKSAQITPVVANSYPNGFYDDEYEYVIDANIEMAQWDVPSVNFMGALDDGTGKWVPAYQAILGDGGPDSAHPNAAGYNEMFYTIVPSLFDALKAEKPQPIKHNNKSLTIDEANSGKVYTFSPDGTVHSFTVSLNVKTIGSGELIKLFSGDTTLTISVDPSNGTLEYSSTNTIIDGTTVLNDGEWHTISFTHYYAAARSILYVDGNAEGEAKEQIVLSKVDLNSPTVTEGTQFSNLIFYRSGMTKQEIALLSDDSKLLKSSLEVYAPLDGTNELPLLTNLAQSTVSLKVSGELNQDASLKDLRIDGESLGDFDALKFDYERVLPFGTTTIPEVTVTKNDLFATFEITPAESLPGKTTIVVTAEDQSVSSTYNVLFSLEAPKTDATLSSMKVGGVEIEGFRSDSLKYIFELPFSEQSVPEVDVVLSDNSASYEITPAVELPGTTFIIVTAQDVNITTTYEVVFNLAQASNEARLSDILIEGEPLVDFNSEILTYTIELPLGTTRVPNIEGVKQDPNSSIAYDFAISLPGTSTIIVTAEDQSTTQTYVINFTMEEEVLATNHLSGIKVYPNPVVNILSFNQPLPAEKIKIYNMEGSLQMEVPYLTDRIDVSLLKKGVYFLRYNDQAIKFIKN
ncbi:MAG: Ig-like domain-containing protein [Cyclobacteriaceae bacterium]